MNDVALSSAAPAPPQTAPLLPSWLDPSLLPGVSRAVPVGRCRLHVTDGGEGPTFLFVHGSPVWSFTWRRVVASLRDGFRCVTVDLPGLGLSEGPREPGNSYGRNTDAITGLIETLGLRDLTLVAHATGGPSALEAATRLPERVRAVAVTSTFAWPLDEHPRFRPILRVVGSRAFAAANVGLNLLPRVAARGARSTGPFDASERRAILGPFRRPDARRHLQDLLTDLTRERPRFERLGDSMATLAPRPALIAYGAGDNGFRAGVFERWQRVLPNHRVAVHPRGGHFLAEDDPAFLAAALRRWWDTDVRREDDPRTR